jgi:hypothetical protein
VHSTRIRDGGSAHPSGALPLAGRIMATDPDPHPDGRVRIVVPGRNARSRARGVARAGVTARVSQGRDRIVVGLSAARGRFKYAGYRVLHAPERLVVDLYESAPSAAGARVVFGRPGCLAFAAVASTIGRISATGTERDVFEHSFPVRVRSAAGGVVGQRTVTAAAGRWSARVSYRAARLQIGTLEAVELSAKDGALSCLAQVPVRLRPAGRAAIR